MAWRYNDTTVRQVWAQNRTTISRTLLAYARVFCPYASCLMPVCGRVTMSPHPTEPLQPTSPRALCSAFRPSRQLASILVAWQISSASSTSSLIVLSLVYHLVCDTRDSLSHPTMPPQFYRSLLMTTPKDNAPRLCLQDAACPLCTRVHSHSPITAASKPSVHRSLSLTPSSKQIALTLTPPHHQPYTPLFSPCPCSSVRFALHRSRIATECEMLARLGRIAFPILHAAHRLFGPSPAQRPISCIVCSSSPCPMR